MKVSLIIPAYNEEQRLTRTVLGYAATLRAAYGPDAFEILVVANGCRDNTIAVATQLSRLVPQLRVIAISAAIGKGGAVLEGFRQATGHRVVFADADGSTASASLLALLRALDDHDIVIGSRRLPTSVITCPQPLARRIAGGLFAASVRALFGLPYRDTQCGAKAFQGSIAKQVAAMVRETRWVFDVDLLLCAQRLQLDVAEQAVIWADRAGSKLCVSRTLHDVVMAFWRLKKEMGAMPAARLARVTADGEMLR